MIRLRYMMPRHQKKNIIEESIEVGKIYICALLISQRFSIKSEMINCLMYLIDLTLMERLCDNSCVFQISLNLCF